MAISRAAMGVLFGLSGTLHFTHTRRYTAIMPPQFPAHEALVWISGAAELAGAFGAQIPQTRRASGIGLMALLWAVYPANIHMAVNREQIKGADKIPAALLWARLPLQFPMMWWVWRTTLAE